MICTLHAREVMRLFLTRFFGILFEILFLWENFFLERPRTILIAFWDIEICRNFPIFCRENFDLFWKFLVDFWIDFRHFEVELGNCLIELA
jgi:hypothetical protein